MYWYILGITGIGTWFDIREQKIPVLFLALAAVGVIPIALWKETLPIASRICGLILGLAFLGIAHITGEAIGKADAALIMLVGAGIGFSDLCIVLLLSFAALLMTAMVLIIVKKAGRKSRVPFYPFMAIGEMAFAAIVFFQ